VEEPALLVNLVALAALPVQEAEEPDILTSNVVSQTAG
jgi:hypothetical protein